MMTSGPSNSERPLGEAYPPGPAVSLERPDEPSRGMVLPTRIAGNLMPLCGVKNPRRGDGQTRSLPLDELTINAIARGVPGRGEPRKLVDPTTVIVPHNSLSRFGPNTLAALVLTGANYLFDPLIAEHNKIINRVPLAALSPNMRLGIMACWRFQMFREQPGLFTLGGQAWRIQRTFMQDRLGSVIESATKPYPNEPDRFAPADGLGGLGDLFFDLCIETAREPGALVTFTDDPGHVVPKVIAHPGDFTEMFLKRASSFPGPEEALPNPLDPQGLYPAVLTAAWAANDLSARVTMDESAAQAFRDVNADITNRLREAASRQ